MPLLGFGTWKLDDDQCRDLIPHAVAAGYRLLDTAKVYGNEAGFGDGVRDSSAGRDELFVTTKCWNEDLREGPDAVDRAMDASLERLGMDYVDLYLVHWPVDGFVAYWKAMQKIKDSGRARAIGVSNFLQHHLEELLPTCHTPPAVDQIELHPLLVQPDLQDYLAEHDIRTQAWSPLMQGQLDHCDAAGQIAEQVGKTTAQVILRWALQQGVSTIPKTSRKARIEENADVFDFTLSDEQLAILNAADQDHRFGPDPDEFDF